MNAYRLPSWKLTRQGNQKEKEEENDINGILKPRFFKDNIL